MALAPIIERELRVTARRGKSYWLRIAVALPAAAVCCWVALGTGRDLPPAALGKALFGFLTVLAFAFCLLVGPFITADSISEERRDGTLGLLFLTELKSFHVVAGKWIATSLAGLYGLLAILPALGLPLLLGGVTPGEYGRVALGVVNAILFSLTAAMFVSALSREQTKATLGAVMLILGLAGLVPGLYVFLAAGVLGLPVDQLPPLAVISPAYTGRLALDDLYRAKPHLFWISIGLVQALCWAFFILTALRLPRLWREDPAERRPAPRWLVRLGYTGGWRRVFHRRLDRNPVFALAARLRWPHLVFWSLVSLVAVNVYWIAIGSRTVPGTYAFHQNFALALIFTNRVWITIMACHFLLEARRSGALELFLTSPLPVRTLLRGHWRALLAYFFWPVLAIGGLHVFYVLAQGGLGGQPNPAQPLLLRYHVFSACVSYVNFLTDVLALSAVGAWFSLSSRKPGLALLKTFALVILVPWAAGYFFGGATGLVPARLMGWLQGLPVVGAWFAGSLYGYPILRLSGWLLKNVAFFLWAWLRLRRNFRRLAAGTFEADHSRGDWLLHPFRRGQRTAAPGPAKDAAVP